MRILIAIKIIYNFMFEFVPDLKVSRSQVKTKANNKCFIELKCTCKGLQKSIIE